MAKINYQNLPNTTTPLNATNLNTMQDINTTVALSTYLVNSWETNGYCKVSKINDIIFLTLSVRRGTTDTILTLPSGYRPSGTVIVGVNNGVSGTNATISTAGVVKISDSNQIGNNVYITAIYT